MRLRWAGGWFSEEGEEVRPLSPSSSAAAAPLSSHYDITRKIRRKKPRGNINNTANTWGPLYMTSMSTIFFGWLKLKSLSPPFEKESFDCWAYICNVSGRNNWKPSKDGDLTNGVRRGGRQDRRPLASSVQIVWPAPSPSPSSAFQLTSQLFQSQQR